MTAIRAVCSCWDHTCEDCAVVVLNALFKALEEARDEIQYLCIHKNKDRLDCRQCVLLRTIDAALTAARGTA